MKLLSKIKYPDLPKGASSIFFIQIFATFAYGVLFSTLMLYLTSGLKLNDKLATMIVAAFVAFNYVLHLLGGYIGGRWLSYRTLFLIGMVTQIIGCVLLSLTSIQILFWGLAAFLIGGGFNVLCLNCMLIQLFQPTDKRRDVAFLWNYSAMNMSFFIGYLIGGYFQLSHAYHELFLVACVGNVIAIFIIFFRWKLLADTHTNYAILPASKKVFANIKGLVTMILLVILLSWLLEHHFISSNLIVFIGIAMVIVIAYLAIKQPQAEQRDKIWAYLILAFAWLIFFTLDQLAPMGLILFIERNVNRHFLDILIAPQWVQSLNTIVIILGGPILSMLFTSLRARGFLITAPTQFALALILMGTSFILLPIGIHFADPQGYTNINWIFISSILQSVGGLLIAPTAYAMIGRLIPPHLQGLMMGTWLMIVGVASILSGHFTTMALGSSHSINPLITNPSFTHTFSMLGLITISAGVLLTLLIPFILRLTHEKDELHRSNA